MSARETPALSAISLVQDIVADVRTGGMVRLGGKAVLPNCGETAEQWLAPFEGTARSARAPERARMGHLRRMPGPTGHGLETTGSLSRSA